MQFDKAERLRQMGREDTCDHESISKEYHLGTSTGDFNCDHCGATFGSRAEHAAVRARLLAQRET